VLATTAAAGVATAAIPATAAPEKAAISFGNPDDPPQGSINATNPRSPTDPGPQNPAIRDQFPSAFSPPATDVGNLVAENDRMIVPDTQRYMAERMKAKTKAHAVDHTPSITAPTVVVDIIRDAIRSTTGN
jgi:hypothetical protein